MIQMHFSGILYHQTLTMESVQRSTPWLCPISIIFKIVRLEFGIIYVSRKKLGSLRVSLLTKQPLKQTLVKKKKVHRISRLTRRGRWVQPPRLINLSKLTKCNKNKNNTAQHSLQNNFTSLEVVDCVIKIYVLMPRAGEQPCKQREYIFIVLASS